MSIAEQICDKRKYVNLKSGDYPCNRCIILATNQFQPQKADHVDTEIHTDCDGCKYGAKEPGYIVLDCERGDHCMRHLDGINLLWTSKDVQAGRARGEIIKEILEWYKEKSSPNEQYAYSRCPICGNTWWDAHERHSISCWIPRLMDNLEE